MLMKFQVESVERNAYPDNLIFDRIIDLLPLICRPELAHIVALFKALPFIRLAQLIFVFWQKFIGNIIGLSQAHSGRFLEHFSCKLHFQRCNVVGVLAAGGTRAGAGCGSTRCQGHHANSGLIEQHGGGRASGLVQHGVGADMSVPAERLEDQSQGPQGRSAAVAHGAHVVGEAGPIDALVDIIKDNGAGNA
jgi:hypothetical protein